MAKDTAKQLLLDGNGNYRGDETAVFLYRLYADNDTRSPKNFIKMKKMIS